jgi:hypothetical protein
LPSCRLVGVPESHACHRSRSPNPVPSVLARSGAVGSKSDGEELDRAVLVAYGWSADLAEDEVLACLLALNLEREPA